MLPDLVEHLLRQAAPDLVARAPGVELRALALAGRGPARALNVVVFADETPVLFLKTARAVADDELRLEHEALEELGALGLPDGSVPRSLGVFASDGRLALVQSATEGTPLLAILRRTRRRSRSMVADDVRLVRSWIETLQHHGRLRPAPLDPFAMLDEHEEALSLANDLTRAQSSYLGELRSVGERFAGLSVARTCAHGDLWPGNILVRARRGVSVIDWEDFVRDSSPLRDLWFFLFTYAYVRPRRGWSWDDPGSALDRAFLVDGWYSRLAADAIRSHLLSLRIPLELADLLLFLELLEEGRAGGAANGLRPPGTDWNALALQWADRGGFRQLADGGRRLSGPGGGS